jgi:hypothetical protein
MIYIINMWIGFRNLSLCAQNDRVFVYIGIVVIECYKRYLCWVVTWKEMDWPFKLRYCAGNSVHLIVVQKG